jgi:hypothetical protein
MDKQAGLARIGKSYPRSFKAPPEAVQRFDREVTEPQAKELGVQLAGAIVLVLLLLGVIGWAFTL